MNTTPFFTHDCSECISLGSWRGPALWEVDEASKYDLYIHIDGESKRGSLIARFGNGGDMYYSAGIGSILSGDRSHLPLFIAHTRAFRRGITTIRPYRHEEIARLNVEDDLAFAIECEAILPGNEGKYYTFLCKKHDVEPDPKHRFFQ